MTGSWSMEQDALNSLAKKTASGTQDLGGLVKQLVNAAQPLEGKMSGAGKASSTASSSASTRSPST